MGDDLAKRVLATIANETGCRVSKLLPQMDVCRDLGVDGDDAHELLLRLSNEFEIAMEGMEFNRHFGPEAGFNPLALMLPSWWRWPRERIPVRVADLIEAARTPRWPIHYPREDAG